MFQTIVANVPKTLTIKGAIFVGVDNDEGLNTWKWSILRPTDLRIDPQYIKVILFLQNRLHRHISKYNYGL